MLASHFERVERVTDCLTARLHWVFFKGGYECVFKGLTAKGWLHVNTSCNKRLHGRRYQGS
jgi:hypothetical protein